MVPGAEAGSPMHTAAAIKDHFAKTVVPALAADKADFDELNGHWPPLIELNGHWPPLIELNGHWPPLILVAPLLTAISAVAMMWATAFFMAAMGVGWWRTAPEVMEPSLSKSMLPARTG